MPHYTVYTSSHDKNKEDKPDINRHSTYVHDDGLKLMIMDASPIHLYTNEYLKRPQIFIILCEITPYKMVLINTGEYIIQKVSKTTPVNTLFKRFLSLLLS